MRTKVIRLPEKKPVAEAPAAPAEPAPVPVPA
jgi:hypothetical protein